MNTEDDRNRPKNRRRIYLFIFKKFTIHVQEKYPLLQLDCGKKNHTQIYTEKNVPNNS